MAKIDFNEIQKVSINDLILDTQNPRLNEQPDENACIHAILNGKEQDIINLAKDIADNDLYPERIIASQHPSLPNKWIVRDGNRRIAAIKLLHEPRKAPPAIASKFEEISKKLHNFPSKVNITVFKSESDLLRFLHLKHTGKNDGVGQVEWGAISKALYSEKTGERNQNIKALNLLRWAVENKIIHTFDDNFPISTLADRLMSKERLYQIGFELQGNQIKLIKEPTSTINKVKHIIVDIQSGNLDSRGLNAAEAQKEYIDKLCEIYGDGTIKEEISTLESNKPMRDNTNQVQEPKEDSLDEDNVPPPKPSQRPIPENQQDRKKLFIRNRVPFSIPIEERKAAKILAELKSIEIKSLPIAAAMLLRSLIEYATEYYLRNNSIICSDTRFAPKVRKCAEHMLQNNKITTNKKLVLEKRMSNEGDMMNVNTLHAYVHSPNFHPDYQTLNAFWDEIEFYVTECWNT
ncbi:hypothetical protein [Sulfurospirillum diekertiae]|uniref:ParB/Sulfiredoxin domain-containing protein n=1 Tax=Sulfurospirillum diekertiae TaxID=1854492 RepID=A0A1Y0HH12_9BACT|nr:hypothetical protein [Sulfurospirillum diekertiae]ARU47240.1 hypothetical protein Sdiek1_0052 [Sulfurospirillum diekertiae]ASC92094.1 hypothetical protein Sdiek2_0051 [Sulfurospirillum diekertiae]